MRNKRSIEEIQKSDFCNFSELATVLAMPRITLIRWQDKFSLFPYIIKESNKASLKYYPVKACIKIVELFNAKSTEGYNLTVAAQKVKSSRAYTGIIKANRKKYVGLIVKKNQDT